MATPDISILEGEKLAQTQAYLEALGKEEFEAAKGRPPASLTDYLIRELNAPNRRRLAKRLIDIALGDNDKVALDAIREIADRIDGKARVSVINSRAENDPLMKLLTEVMTGQPTLLATVPAAIEGEVRVLDG